MKIIKGLMCAILLIVSAAVLIDLISGPTTHAPTAPFSRDEARSGLGKCLADEVQSGDYPSTGNPAHYVPTLLSKRCDAHFRVWVSTCQRAGESRDDCFRIGWLDAALTLTQYGK